jgi:uncharacterized protein
MATNETVRVVAGLWRFPVKSMRGERIEEAEVSQRGIVGDRAFALIDVDTGRVASAKSVRLFPDLLRCRATFVEEPRADRELPPVRIELPDGRTVMSDSDDADRALSAHFRREVRLASAAPEDFTIDQYHPDIEGANPAGHRDAVVAQKLGSALFAELGAPSPVPAGAFFDVFPVSLLTTATLARLTELQPESRFDQRRFRMNVIVQTSESGFPENDWIGREIGIGGSVCLRLETPDSRCVMTTLAQEDLRNDPGILRALVRHNRLQVGADRVPCAGAYAVVEAPGTVRTGDPVSVRGS